jgi:hypothetical protein
MVCSSTAVREPSVQPMRPRDTASTPRCARLIDFMMKSVQAWRRFMVEDYVLVSGENRSGSRLLLFNDGIPVDPGARERRQQLERIAFGRTNSREDEAAATAARKELAEADRTAQVAVRERATSDEFETRPHLVADDLGGMDPLPDGDMLPPPPPPEPPRKVAQRMRSAWLVPIIAAAIAVGYFGSTTALTSALQEPVLFTDPVVPSPVVPSPSRAAPSNGGTPAGGPSSLKEADAWFETLPRDSYAVPDAGTLQSLQIEPSAIRFVQIDATGLQVWVARNLDGDLCLLATGGVEEQGSSAFAGCSSREQFARSGVTLSQNDYSMSWNGSSVTVSTPKPVGAP